MGSGSGKPLSLGYQIQMLATNNHSQSPTPTLLLLKDYLREDLTSCSSSGFKSLPRQQCCLQQPRSSSCYAKLALRKASEAVLKAVNSLPVPPRQSSISQTRTFVSRSLSFWSWRRASKKNSSTVKEDSYFPCSLTAAEDSVTAGSVTTTNTCSTRDLPNEEKEEFSPVSVLDCPLYDDHDEEIASPFNSTSCSLMEGAKHKHMQKSRRHINRVASLKKISWTVLQEDEPILVSIVNTEKNGNLFRDRAEENAHDLLRHVKNSIPSVCLRIGAENLLFDFFKQGIGDNSNVVNENSMKRHLCKVAEDWIRGKPREQDLSLQIGHGRQLYVMEMDKCGNWRDSDEETQSLAMELEVEFSISLVNELVLDLTAC